MPGVLGQAGRAAGVLGAQLVVAGLSRREPVSGGEVAVGESGRGEGVGGEGDACRGNERGVVMGRGQAV